MLGHISADYLNLDETFFIFVTFSMESTDFSSSLDIL